MRGSRETEQSRWAKARTLAERRAAPPDGRTPGELPQGAAREAAELLDWWRETYLNGSKRLLNRRLRALGLDRDTVLPLLAACHFGIADCGFRIADERPTTNDQRPATAGRQSAANLHERQRVIRNPQSAIPTWQAVLAEIL